MRTTRDNEQLVRDLAAALLGRHIVIGEIIEVLPQNKLVPPQPDELVDAPLENFPETGLLCSVCREIQYLTPGGLVVLMGMVVQMVYYQMRKRSNKDEALQVNGWRWLHPEGLGLALRHPLVFGVPYISQMNNFYNQRYTLLQAAVADALKSRDLSTYVFTHEHPHRLDAFCEYLDRFKVSDSAFWGTLGQMWVDSENIFQNLDKWHDLLLSKRSSNHKFMNKSDKKHLELLPDQFEVYRGCTLGLNENGLSWTLNRSKAEWFSKRLLRDGETPQVLHKVVSKKRVFAYLNDRGEEEIILLKTQ